MLKHRKCKISVDPLFFAVLAAVWAVGYLHYFLITLVSIALHELGHIFVAILMGKQVYSLRILPVGLNASIDDSTCSKAERIILYAAGPAVNILLFGFSGLINAHLLQNSVHVQFFSSMNICLALFNLIPILPLDGGGILRELLADRFGIFHASRYARRVSLILALVLTLLGVILAGFGIYNISLLAVGIYILFIIKYEKTEAALMNARGIIYRRARLLKKGVYPARELVVIKSVQLGEVIKSMDFDRFHIIHVLDKDLRVEKTLTEQQLIDGMLKHNTDMTFEEFLKQDGE